MPVALLLLSLAAAQSTAAPEPGTRLLPFGEDLPDRGPLAATQLAPPLRLGDVQFSRIAPIDLTDEERAVLLRRARLEAEGRGLFAAGPKDPWKAVALSAEAMALSLVVPPLWIIAGSVGQAYAGNWLEAAIMSAARLGCGIWILVEGIEMIQAFSTSSTLGAVISASQHLNLAAGIGGTVILGTSAADLFTVYGVADRANQRWEASALQRELGFALAPTSGGARIDAQVHF